MSPIKISTVLHIYKSNVVQCILQKLHNRIMLITALQVHDTNLKTMQMGSVN